MIAFVLTAEMSIFTHAKIQIWSCQMFSAYVCRIGCEEGRELPLEQRRWTARSLNKPVLRPAPTSGWRPVWAKRTMTQCGVTPKRCYRVEHSPEPAARTLKIIHPGVSPAVCHAQAGRLVTFPTRIHYYNHFNDISTRDAFTCGLGWMEDYRPVVCPQ